MTDNFNFEVRVMWAIYPGVLRNTKITLASQIFTEIHI